MVVEDTDPHIIGITDSRVNTDISDAELGHTGYVVFIRDRMERRGGGVILYFNESIQAYEIKLDREADCLAQYSYRKYNINYWISLHIQ